ncbi:MAG: 1-acyl-sn-glycerol-3-phosphate acyltransferase [Bacteroidales bacterium]|jgi:putative hemolysin|nr:1-acyl-sn-glycerol-3-phosphate acyltransferase [Bacteroidales bacterium]
MELNVKAVIAAKNPKLLKWIPRFIVRWLEKTIHQDEMNSFYQTRQHLPSLEFAHETVKLFNPTITINHEENIPKTGRYIVVSNHPLGGLDGISLVSIIGKHRSDIKVPVNDLLLFVEPLKEIFVPIAKVGKHSRKNMEQLEQVFKGDDLIIYFPAGLCSRRKKGVIRDPAWKKTIIAKARENNRDIIPVYFDGHNSNWFYNLSNFRKKIGIKTNIEMLYLVDEMYRQNGNSFTVTFGKPISCQTFDKTKSDAEWALWLQEEVYQLKIKN